MMSKRLSPFLIWAGFGVAAVAWSQAELPSGPEGAATSDEMAPVALTEGDAVLTDRNARLGQPVSVSGKVAQIVSPRLFTVDTDGKPGGGDLVIEISEETRLPAVGQRVLIQGSLARHDPMPEHTAAADRKNPGLVEHGPAVIVKAQAIAKPVR